MGTSMGVILDYLCALLLFVLMFLISGMQAEKSSVGSGPYSYPEQIKLVREALEYVDSINVNNCNNGTGNKLTLNFDHDSWQQYTNAAIKAANFLNSILAIDGNLSRFRDDVFYSMVRNNVHGNSLIFGSAIALEPQVIQNRQRFCPYSCRDHKNNTVTAFNLAIYYDYRTNRTDWYDQLLISDLSNVSIIVDKISTNASSLAIDDVYIRQPEVTYKDGRWTYPYFDCGAGNIWMSTYSAPIVSVTTNGTRMFRGVATIDIELTNLNINQCNQTDNRTENVFDIFSGSHSCQATTTCVPLNLGFRSGAYLCYCKEGFYFPNTSATVKAFNGNDIEEYFESHNSTFVAPQFQCVRCPRECDTCVDATPCLYEVSPAVQALVVIIISLMIVACILVSGAIVKNKKQLVIKTASPIFLQLMCAGAIIMCSSVFVRYGEATKVKCVIQVWFFHVGFTVMYGALLIKTWRISVIFKSGGATKRINLPDKALLKRMFPLVAVVVVYMALWSALNPPRATRETTSENLKFFNCSMSWWTYTMFGAEVLMLLVGVYLCFTVRKAPAHFNESKFITWSTYNAIILGSFIIMLTQFIGVSAGPDIVFVLLMVQQQVFVTVNMALIFIPKFWTLYKGVSGEGEVYSNHVMTITGRVKPAFTPGTASGLSSDTKSIGIQCKLEGLFCTLESEETESVFNKPSSSVDSGISREMLPLHSTNLVVPDINDTIHHFSTNA